MQRNWGRCSKPWGYAKRNGGGAGAEIEDLKTQDSPEFSHNQNCSAIKSASFLVALPVLEVFTQGVMG